MVCIQSTVTSDAYILFSRTVPKTKCRGWSWHKAFCDSTHTSCKLETIRRRAHCCFQFCFSSFSCFPHNSDCIKIWTLWFTPLPPCSGLLGFCLKQAGLHFWVQLHPSTALESLLSLKWDSVWIILSKIYCTKAWEGPRPIWSLLAN